MSQHEYQDPEAEAADSAFINFIICTCVVPVVTRQKVLREKGVLITDWRPGTWQGFHCLLLLETEINKPDRVDCPIDYLSHLSVDGTGCKGNISRDGWGWVYVLQCVCVCVFRDIYVHGQHQLYQYYFHKLSGERILICLPCWSPSPRALVKMHFISVQARPDH